VRQVVRAMDAEEDAGASDSGNGGDWALVGGARHRAHTQHERERDPAAGRRGLGAPRDGDAPSNTNVGVRGRRGQKGDAAEAPAPAPAVTAPAHVFPEKQARSQSCVLQHSRKNGREKGGAGRASLQAPAPVSSEKQVRRWQRDFMVSNSWKRQGEAAEGPATACLHQRLSSESNRCAAGRVTR